MSKAKIFLVNTIFTVSVSYIFILTLELDFLIRFFGLPFIVGLIIPFAYFYFKKISFLTVITMCVVAASITVAIIISLFTLSPFLLAGF